MYFHKVGKSTLSIFDDKRCYINETESIPRNWKTCFYWKRFFISTSLLPINEWKRSICCERI